MSSGISNFNTTTGLIVSDNSAYPAIGTATSDHGGGCCCATVHGIVSRAGGCDTDAEVIIGAGLSYFPAGGAGGTLSIRTGDNPTNGTALGVATIPREVFVDGNNNVNLNAINNTALNTTFTDKSAVMCYKNTQAIDGNARYIWEEYPPVSTNTGMPIGCIIMYYTNTGFTADNAGVNGYYLTFGVEIWKLCDGTTGSLPTTGSLFGATPNLINKFARGIDTSAPPAVLPEAITINIAALSVANIPTLNSTDVAFAGKQSGMPNQSATAGDIQNVDHLHDEWTGEYIYINPPSAGFQFETLPVGGPYTNAISALISGFAHDGTTPQQSELQTHKHAIDITGGTSSCGTAVPSQPTGGGTGIKPTSQDVLYIVRVV